jgi:hypothetical protein
MDNQRFEIETNVHGYLRGAAFPGGAIGGPFFSTIN